MHLLERIKRYDESRSGIPGEHWMALGAGMALWLATRKHPSTILRLLASVGGTLLVSRAMTGRNVPPALTKLPYVR